MRTKATAILCVTAGILLIAVACTTSPPHGGGGGGVTPNFAPNAVLMATPTAGSAPLTVVFSGLLSSDPDGVIAGYEWDFGDGDHSTDAEPSHDYNSPGTYTVTLEVTDSAGLTDIDSQVIEVDSAFDGVTFVDDSGSTLATCGVLTDPCSTISQGIARAAEDGNTDVYVADGTYSSFRVLGGVSVTGGYDAGFLGASGTTVVNGSFDVAAGVSAAIIADNVAAPTTISGLTAAGSDESALARQALGVYVSGTGNGLTLEGLTIEGGHSGTSATGLLVDGASTVAVDAATVTSGSPKGAGSSAYGVRALHGAVVNIDGGSITAADGIAGTSGGAAPAAAAAGCNGSLGANASGPSSPGAGGSGCAGTVPTTSGAGGRGGDYSAAGAAGVAGGAGAPGGNGGCGSGTGCGTNAGGGGAGAAGAAGAPGIGAGNTVGGTETFLGANGGAGTAGLPGAGAGGGGGGKSASASGGGGGGGGGGGAGGAAGTVGGTAGGGSFGVYGFDASVNLTNVAVTASTGGNGGRGQAGGQSGNGGNGGGGGTRSCCFAGGGGGGGGGGTGGGGAGAGGGAGGPSVALLHRGTGVISVSNSSLSAGIAALGGAGGNGGTAGAGGTGGAGTQDGGNGAPSGSGHAGANGTPGASGLALGVWDNGATSAPTSASPTTTTTTTTTTTPPAISTYTAVQKTCQTTASGQTRVNPNPTGATVLAPTSVPQFSIFQIELTPDPMNVPTEGEGYPIGYIANLQYRFVIPTGTTFVTATTSGGSGLGSGTVTAALNSDDVVLAVPGTLAAGTTAVLPKVTVTLKATGAPGSSIQTRFGGSSYADPSLVFQTRVNNIPLLGSVTSNSNCYTVVNPVLSTTTIS